MTVPLRAALYLRVSTVRQAEHDVSIPDQKRQGEAYCASRAFQPPPTPGIDDIDRPGKRNFFLMKDTGSDLGRAVKPVSHVLPIRIATFEMNGGVLGSLA